MPSSLLYSIERILECKVESMGFNQRGTRLAAITKGGFINLWNAISGQKYFPVFGPEVGLRAYVVWMDSTGFLCGIQNGYLLACYLDNDEEEDCSLTVTKRKIFDSLSSSDHEACINALSYEQSLHCLAVSMHDSIHLWMRDAKEWHFRQSLTYACVPRHSDQLVCITSVAWVPETKRILATYLNHDIVVWDFESSSVIFTIKSWGHNITRSEILNNRSGTRLATLDSGNLFDVYDIASGVVWSPSTAMHVFSLKSVHRGTTCVLGSNGKSELLDIENGLIMQVLDQGDGAAPVTAITAHQNEAETDFMIATASPEKCIIWKTKDSLT